MPLSDEELLQLARRHQDRVIGVAREAARQVGTAWDHFGGLDDAAMRSFVDAATPVVQAARGETAALTDAYLAGAVEVDPIGVTAADVTYRGGLEVAEVYQRPVVTARTAISRGVAYAEAIAQGRARAVQLADTDAMVAARDVANAVMRQLPGVVGYRRVPDASACEFCLVAATQRYHTNSLMPIHPGCHCGVVPIVGVRDPGRIIDREAHARLKADGAIDRVSYAKAVADGRRQVDDARSKADEWRAQAAAAGDDHAKAARYEQRAKDWDARADARAVKLEADKARLAALRAGDPSSIAVHEHGELGPVLYPAGQRFDGAA